MELMSGPPLSVFKILHLPLSGSLVLAEALLPLGSLPRLLQVPRPPVPIPVIVPIAPTPASTLTAANM